MTDLSYSGAGHTRLAARQALIAALTSAPFGDYAAVKSAFSPVSDDFPSVRNRDVASQIFDDDPTDTRWDGTEDLSTRLAVISETSTGQDFLGGTGSEVSYTLAIDWMVSASAHLDQWRTPIFEHAMMTIGSALSNLIRTPQTAWIDLSIGTVELVQFDLGEYAVSTASIPLELTLDAETPLA